MRSLAARQKPVLPIAIFATLLLAAWMTLNIERQPLLIYAMLYAMVFWFVAWKYTAFTIILVFAIAPFQNDLGRGGLHFSLTEVHIALLLPIVLLRCYLDRRPFQVGPTLIPVLLYFAVCIYTSLHNHLGRSTEVSIVQMAIYLLIVVGIFATYPTRAEQFRPALYGLLAVCTGIALYSLATRNNFFLGLGKNGVGQALSCAVLVGVELWFAAKNHTHKRILIGVLAILIAGLVFSVSRGAWLGCFMGILLICALRRQYQLMIRVSIVLIPMIALAWQFLPESTRDYATSFDRSRYNIEQRYIFIDTARELWEQSPIIGSGVGLRKQYDATNLIWSTLAETGVLGLGAFIMIHVAFFGMIFRTHKHLQRDTIHYSILLIGGALVLRHFTHGMVDHYWSRGAVTLAWGGAGMAAYSYFVVQRELRLRRQQAAQEWRIRTNLRQRISNGRSIAGRSSNGQPAAHRTGISRVPSARWSRTHTL